MTYDRELRTEAAHALTHNQEVWSDRGYAVVTAGGLSEGDTDFELDVGPYDVLVGDTDTVSVGPTTLSVNAPDSDPYWLVVYADGEGLQTEQGPEGEVFVGDQSVVASNADVREITSPAPPTLADIGPVTVLGKVLVTSSGVTNSLIDDRVFQSERVFESVDANEVTTENFNTPPTSSIVSLNGDQTIADNTVTRVEFEDENTKGDVTGLLNTTDNVVVVPDGYNFAKITAGFTFSGDVELNFFQPRLNGSAVNGFGQINYDDSNVAVRADSVSSAWASVSDNDEISVRIRQRSGGDVTLQDAEQTFLEVRFL